ncbi:MAG: hypothetical protein HYX22_02220 [Candidatus Yanofskybacteria bacterium]|nr:hypothetical protein [Candidatus Yanofskybacteria bacterium]
MKQFEFNEVVSALTHIRGGIPAVRLSTRIRLGQHRSIFFGPSYDFYDIQEYDPERDPPNQIIHSSVGSDEDMIYARKCIEQHEVKVIVLSDLSSSIDAGTDFARRRLLLESIGYIGLTAARYQNPLGLVGFADKVILKLPARCGQNNFYHLLRLTYDFLAERDPDQAKTLARKTDFFVALDFVRRSFGQRCFIPMVSDFIGFENVVNSSLLRTVAAKHELIFIFLDDPMELIAAQGIGYLRMENIEDEDGKQAIVSRRKLPKLEKDLRQKRKELRRELARLSIGSTVLEYGKHFNRLHRFFTKRHKLLNVRH